jgi:hypothetical protein
MKAMRTAALYLAAGLAGGFALAALLGDRTNDDRAAYAPDGAAAAPLEPRITRLESRLDTVIAQNTALAEELERLDSLFADIRIAAQPELEARLARAAGAGAATDDPGTAPLPELREQFQQVRGFRGPQLSLVDSLTAAGFSSSDAQHIETRIEELRVAAMQSRYEAQLSGEPQNVMDQLRVGSDTLRAELGEADYERYLAATGRPTRVDITAVLASSAAQTAGLQPGDQIVAYGGERVFDVRELNQVLLEGEPGEPVIVDIERDGQPMQLVIPRGPLGISSGFARRGGR